MNNDSKLDEILAIVRIIAGDSQSAHAQINRFDYLEKELAEEREDRHRDAAAYGVDRQHGTRAALTAWDLLSDAVWLLNHADIKSSPKWVEKREKFGDGIDEYLSFCREHIWTEEEDPYYDPNQGQ